MFARFLLAIALAGALATSAARAEPADDQYALAAGHYTRGQWQFASEEFQKFLADHPDHAKATSATFFLAESMVQLGKSEEARRRFRELLERQPDHRFARQALYRVGEASFLLGDMAAARPELEDFQAKFPDDALNAHVLPYLGEIALSAGEFERAKSLFEQGLSRYPESRVQDDARFGLARALERLGQIEEAARTFMALAAKQASPLADDAQFELGSLQYEQGLHDESLRTFEEFETTFKDSPYRSRARLARGWAQFQLGDFQKAAKFFEALEKVPETATEAGYWLGLTYKARREWAAAAEKLGGLQVATDHALAPAIAYHAADARLRSGDAAGAALAFDAQMAQWPASEWIDDAMLGRVQAALANADHAAVDHWAARFEEQQAASPLLTDLRRDRANSLVARKQFAEAIALIEPIVASDRATFADRYLLAVAHAGAGRPTEALALLDPARGEPPAELRADALLARAAALVALERYEDAIAPLEACLALAPDASRAAKAQAQLAVCHGHARRLDQARTAYEALVALDPPAELLLPTTQVVADAALAAGDRGWSAELFAKLGTEQMPADFAAKGLSGLAWSQYEEGRLAEAAAGFEELLRRYPEDALASEAALTRGQILEKLEQPKAALAMYQDVIDKHPQSKQLSPALLAAARLHATAGQDERAAELYARWLRDHPDVTGPDAPARDAALYQAAWVERRLGRIEQADALFQQLRADHPQSQFVGDATYRLAERAIETGDQPRAIALLDELLASEANPSVAQHALYLRGQVAVAARDWPGVATFMGRLVERFPDSALRPRAEYWVADALYKQNQFDAAAAALAALAPRVDQQREPWTAMIPLRRAQALVQQRKWADARAIAERIATDYPGFEQQFEADYALGRCLAGLAEFQAARDAYRRVIDDPRGHGTETAAMAQWMIGETYYHQKEYAAALREFLKVEILYDYPVWQAAALLEAGKCHEHLGEWKQAAEMYARVVKEFPNTEVQEECQRRLRAARERLAAKR